jgi:hypothetical protein
MSKHPCYFCKTLIIDAPICGKSKCKAKYSRDVLNHSTEKDNILSDDILSKMILCTERCSFCNVNQCSCKNFTGECSYISGHCCSEKYCSQQALELIRKK